MSYTRKNPPANYITLIDGGYWARFTAIKGGKQVNLKQKTFRFTAYNNDPVLTKQVAEKWVKYWAPRLKKPQSSLERKKRYRVRKHGDTTIRVGVTKVVECKETKNGGASVYTAYRATWSETVDGKRQQRARYFGYDASDKEAEAIAKEKAIEVREKMEALHYDGPIDD